MRRSSPPLVPLIISLTILTIGLSLSAATAAEYVSIKKDGVNIRSGPSTKNEIIWEVFKDYPLKVVEKKGKWSKTVDFEGDSGWIFEGLLSSKKTVIVKADRVNMRVGPGENYEIVATVKNGVVFDLAGKKGEWFKLKHADGTEGWIHKDLLWPSDL